MGFYEKYILPKLTDILCSAKPLMKQRQKIVPLAEGRVLEIGIGSGLNLPFYDKAKVEHVWGLDPSKEIIAMAEKQARGVGFDVEFIRLSGEEIPLDDRSADTVLVTYTLCTIPDVVRALEGMRRILKPGGELIFCEHGAAPDKAVRRWQNRIRVHHKESGNYVYSGLEARVLQLLGHSSSSVDFSESGGSHVFSIASPWGQRTCSLHRQNA
jgi:ubiquinone/menaquinone biosynthesis C-methylase UbiE